MTRGLPHCTGTKTLTAEGTSVDLGEIWSVVIGNFPVTGPKAVLLMGCKETFNVLAHPKVCLIKGRQCTLVWLQVWLVGY